MTKETSHQISKEMTRRKHAKGKTFKESLMGANKHVIKQKRVS